MTETDALLKIAEALLEIRNGLSCITLLLFCFLFKNMAGYDYSSVLSSIRELLKEKKSDNRS